MFVVVLDKGICHIDTEAVAAVGKPEEADIRDRVAGRHRVFGVDRHLPAFGRMQETVIESRLALEEVEHVGAVSLAFTCDIGVALHAADPEIRPDITAGIFIFGRLAAGLKPLMLLGGMARDQVQKHMHAALVGFVEQLVQVLVRPVAGGYLLVVADVVARVLEGRVVAGIDPERVRAQGLYIVQLADDSLKVADPIPVAVLEGLGIDLIKYGVFEPCRHNVTSFACGMGGFTVCGGS